MENRLILVAGSGRSGTSLFSGILKALGCHVPQPEVKADGTNPRGFGEPKWVVHFHMRLLRQAGVQTADGRPLAASSVTEILQRREVEEQLHSWLSARFEEADHVVIKDPRMLWFLPLWGKVGDRLNVDVRHATVLRHPTQVIKSKITSYGESAHPTSRTAGWINTMLFTERITRHGVRTFTTYDDLVADWSSELARVSAALDLAVLDRATPAHLAAAGRLVEPSLRRSVADWDTLAVHRPVAELAEQTWGALVRLAVMPATSAPALLCELDELRERYDGLYDQAEAVAQSSITAACSAAVTRPTPWPGARELLRRQKRRIKRLVRRSRRRRAQDPLVRASSGRPVRSSDVEGAVAEAAAKAADPVAEHVEPEPGARF